MSDTDLDSILDLCEFCHDYPCRCTLDDIAFDEEMPEDAYCSHCGKAFEDFSDMGCEYCDQRHPGFGTLP